MQISPKELYSYFIPCESPHSMIFMSVCNILISSLQYRWNGSCRDDSEGLYLVFSSVCELLLLSNLRGNSAASAKQYSFVQTDLLTPVQVLGFIMSIK